MRKDYIIEKHRQEALDRETERWDRMDKIFMKEDIRQMVRRERGYFSKKNYHGYFK